MIVRARPREGGAHESALFVNLGMRLAVTVDALVIDLRSVIIVMEFVVDSAPTVSVDLHVFPPR